MTPHEMFGIEPVGIYWIVEGGLRQVSMTFTRPPTVPVLVAEDGVSCGCQQHLDGGLWWLRVCEGHVRLLV